MAINFHDPAINKGYASRQASEDWKAYMLRLMGIKTFSQGVEIGCGGGIYSRALAEMGVLRVTGIDFSETMLETARKKNTQLDQIDFQAGEAYNTGLKDGFADIVLERAVLHHLEDLPKNFSEVNRILQKGGLFIIQDRTPEDCFLKGSPTHIRGFLFENFPHLAEMESKRRYKSSAVMNELRSAGFSSIEEVSLWETRKIYESKGELLADLRARTGRSILHELTDRELDKYTMDVADRVPDGKIVEQDRWTVWMAVKNP